MEIKTFSIIHFRELDSPESEDIIKILQSVMLERDIKTGQKALEYIVRAYKRLSEKCYNDEQKYKQEIENLKFSNQNLSQQLYNNSKYFDTIKAFKKVLNEL